MIPRNFILAALVPTTLASLCVDHQKSGDQVLLAVQPCENATSTTPSDTESAMSIFIRSAQGEPEADLADTLKSKLDSGDLAGYMSTKRDFERGQSGEFGESAESLAIDTDVTIHTTQNYTLQNSAHLQKRGGCSMYWPGDVGLAASDIHYYNDFFYPETSTVNWVCLGECTDYVDHMWADGTLSGSFYYTYNDCKFRSQNGWNGRTSVGLVPSTDLRRKRLMSSRARTRATPYTKFQVPSPEETIGLLEFACLLLTRALLELGLMVEATANPSSMYKHEPS